MPPPSPPSVRLPQQLSLTPTRGVRPVSATDAASMCFLTVMSMLATSSAAWCVFRGALFCWPGRALTARSTPALQMHGDGSFLWAAGDVYRGNWEGGLMSGHGTKTLANGDSYSGAWVDGKACGWGEKQFACADKHEGFYMADRRHSYGRYSFANGDRYEGRYLPSPLALGVSLRCWAPR